MGRVPTEGESRAAVGLDEAADLVARANRRDRRKERALALRYAGWKHETVMALTSFTKDGEPSEKNLSTKAMVGSWEEQISRQDHGVDRSGGSKSGRKHKEPPKSGRVEKEEYDPKWFAYLRRGSPSLTESE